MATVSSALQASVLQANKDLARRGLALFGLGHVSGIDRRHGLVVSRAGDAILEKLNPKDLVVTDLSGRVVRGKRAPVPDLATHLEIYRAFPSMGGVARVHSEYATVWAQAGLEIVHLGTTHADHFNGPIPVTRAMTPAEIAEDYEKNVGKVIVERFDGEPRSMHAVLVSRQTCFVWAATPHGAVRMAVMLEAIARLAYKTAVLNPAVGPLPQELLWKHYRRAHPEWKVVSEREE